MDVCSDSDIQAFRQHATIFIFNLKYFIILSILQTAKEAINFPVFSPLSLIWKIE
jgi:hypothetical protein